MPTVPIGSKNVLMLFLKVEHLVHGEGLMAAYDLLDHFCELIAIRLSYIRKNKECPSDVNEAVSSLIFASSRCGDLPELREIRRLFGTWYGQRFATVALELLPGNLVNWQVKDKLSVKCVREDEKKRFLEEMAIKYGIQTCPLAIDCISEPQGKQEEEEDTRVETSRDSDATHSWGEEKHEYNEDNNKVMIKNTNRSQQDQVEEELMFPVGDDDQRVFLFKTPPLLLHGDTRNDKERSRGGRRRRRKGMSGVMDMQSTLYYHSCWYRRRMHQKRSSFLSNAKLCYVLAVVGCLSENKEGGEIVEAKCNGGGAHPSHVHPKLPNWEEFYATFVAMRRAHLHS